ncbi:hypothetical protein B0H63DRAFT_477197 [Podospora didyma]|uniref:2EXR domain-containing protein n=1 Tax=Podospora didyma TaxID=330526 RepID=A0AAE0KKA7_9PEZI|nr:hypothetical protein B0H63DRAFT_477197 [Podospora didyma]
MSRGIGTPSAKRTIERRAVACVCHRLERVMDHQKTNDIAADLGKLSIAVDTDKSNKPSTTLAASKLPIAPVAPTMSAASVLVTVTEIPPTPPFSPAPPEMSAEDQQGHDLQVTHRDDTKDMNTFHFFPFLPAELRLYIWHLSFLPRIVELHKRRTHYADDDRFPRWQSYSRNPAALAVNVEARAAALEFYTVSLPLAAPLARHQTVELPGQLHLSGRRLYLNLVHDTVIVLGSVHFSRLTRLLGWFRAEDRSGTGLRRLAMSVASWAHEAGAATLKLFARTGFTDVEEFVLLMYNDLGPPADWTGGRVVFKPCRDTDYHRRFVMGKGKQFREGDGWMVVGKQPLKVVDVNFLNSW